MKHTIHLASMAIICGTIFVSQAFATPVLEPKTQRFLDELTAAHVPPIPSLSPADARALLDHAQTSVPVASPPVSSADRTLSVGPTGHTRVRIYRPSQTKEKLPVIIYYHGAGWVMGGPVSHDRLARDLAYGSRAELILVDYDRSPEARYPIAIEQDYAVLKYVANHAAELGVDATKIAIAGDSVGGNMVAVVAQLIAEQRGPKLVAQVLFYPVTDATMNDASYHEFADGPWLTAKAMDYFWNQYLPSGTDRTQPHVSPLNAPMPLLRNQPPALVITDENDVLRDEGEAYARKLIQAGVSVTATRYGATIHDFVMLNALAQTPAAVSAVAQATSFLRQAFMK
ncbi:alpha/beta hydrolase [Gluconobacter albidus]|uniref:alpha/beta hydrolase n=1 Tax=Gluconobacter albidus TaxID=318683 RepID=UPI0030AEB9AB